MSAPPRVLLVCSGLDHARRGFESFARECFEELQGESEIELELVKASGPEAPRERVARALRRDQRIARTLGRAFRFRPFRLEALTFALGLQPVLRRRSPDLVYVSEWDTAYALARIRPLTRQQRYRILLCNGGLAATGFEHLDHVQELTPAARDYVVARGADPDRHTVLPLGFRIPDELLMPTSAEKVALRNRLTLPERRPVVLTVAALNRTHKRLDYLIEELAALPQPRPFLLMAGEPDGETAGLRELAQARLSPEGFSMRTVPAEEVVSLYRAADTFVLTSLVEAQGRALIEAAGYGLPCLAHDGHVTRFALGDHAMFGDLGKPGELTHMLRAQAARTIDTLRAQAEAAHRHVHSRFSWKHLRPRYVEFLRRVAWAKSTVSSSTAEKLSR
jgi:glycosyltransferase involved in cell wall biosynthesis